MTARIYPLHPDRAPRFTSEQHAQFRAIMQQREERRRVTAHQLMVERTRNAADQCAHCGQHIPARSLLAIIPARGVVMHTECASGGRV